MMGTTTAGPGRSVRSKLISTTVLAILAGLSGGAPFAAHAQQLAAQQTFQFDLPEQALAKSINDVALITGIQVLYAGSESKDLVARAVQGRMTAEEALSSLLSGTGYDYEFTRPNVITLKRLRANGSTDGARVLGPVRVEGADQNSPKRGEGVAQLGGIRGEQDQEERGLRPVVAAVGTGAPTALEDIPRSVSVLTQAQIEAQDVQDFGEAVRRLPGVGLIERTSATGSNGARSSGSIRSRGFNVSTIQVDGGAPRQIDIINNGLLNLNSYERLELVRGPNGVFAGAGSPGGSINLVRKRPGAEPVLTLSATAGSFDRLQGTADWSTPNVLGTAFAARGVASYEDQDFKWDNDHLKRASLYGIVDAPLGDRARLEMGGQWQSIREDGFYQGSYRYYDGPNLALPFYYNYTPEWSFVDAENFELFSRLYVRLLEDWNFDFGLTYSDSSKRSRDTAINGLVFLLSNTNAAYQSCSRGVCTPSPTLFFARENQLDGQNLGVDFRITGNFHAWGLDHNVFVAAQYNELISVGNELGRSNPAWPQIFTLEDYATFSHLSPPTSMGGSFVAADDAFKDSSSSYGLTVADVISWRERIFLTMSARLQDQEASTGSLRRRRLDGGPYDVILGETSLGNVNLTQQWRPSWALAVKPLRAMTVYGSYSDGSQDQGTMFDSSGKQLGPMTYKNAEVGVKYGVWNWLLSAAGYRLQQENVATQVPGSRGLCGPTPTSSCYFTGGATVEGKGFDVELSGRLFDQLDLQLSYTSNRTTTLSSNLPAESRSPEKLAKLFANWDLPWLPRLSLNLGAVYTGRIFQSGTRTIYDPDTFAIVDRFPFEFAEPATTIWDVGADYAISDNVRLNLLIENVSDTNYYSTVGTVVNHVGNPRTFMLKAIWQQGDGPAGARGGIAGLAPFGNAADWYGSLDVGQQNSGDWQAQSSGRGPSGEPIRWNFETESSPAFGARLGYRLDDHWRSEVDFGWRQSEFGKVGGSHTVPYGLCSLDYVTNFVGTAQDRMTHCYDPQGEAVYWSFLANVIHDFRSPDARLRPFLGVGLGATRASVDFSGRLDGYTDTAYRSWYQSTFNRPLSSAVAPGEKVLGADASWGLSFQAIAGMSWRVTDRATLDATYKYTRDRLDIRTANLTHYYAREFISGTLSEPNRLSGAGLPPIGSFKGDLDTHIFSIGLRWAFGARPL